MAHLRWKSQWASAQIVEAVQAGESRSGELRSIALDTAGSPIVPLTQKRPADEGEATCNINSTN